MNDMIIDTEIQPRKFDSQIDPYEKCLRLETAIALLDARVAKIMGRIYAERDKKNPDKDLLDRLDKSHSAVWDDRRSMYKKNSGIESIDYIISKYKSIRDNDLDPSIAA